MTACRGDVDGGLELVAEFPSSPPHSSSLATAMQVSLERGEEEDVEKIKDTMIRISGEENTFNRMFFVFLKSGETTRASQLLEVRVHHSLPLCLLVVLLNVFFRKMNSLFMLVTF